LSLVVSLLVLPSCCWSTDTLTAPTSNPSVLEQTVMTFAYTGVLISP